MPKNIAGNESASILFPEYTWQPTRQEYDNVRHQILTDGIINEKFYLKLPVAIASPNRLCVVWCDGVSFPWGRVRLVSPVALAIGFYAKFSEIPSRSELEEKINEFGLPVLLKTRRDAYDGRGNFKINSSEHISEGLKIFEGKSLMLEEFIDFKMEVSVIAARSTTGEIQTYPLVENIHEDNILRTTIAPARISDEISKKAEEIAHKTMEVLHGAGVFGIEMFVTNDDQLLINEIAPRVHNSGHHTLQSSKTSQFEQHLRAILGMELGSTKLLHPTIMYNILGPTDFTGKYKIPSTTITNSFLKMYGKLESKPKRKIGHVNLVDADNLGMENLLEKLTDLKKNIMIESE